MERVAVGARIAGQHNAATSIDVRNNALKAIADSLGASRRTITEANGLDLRQAEENSLPPAVVKRLIMDDDKIDAVIAGLHDVIGLDDPLGANECYEQIFPVSDLRILTHAGFQTLKRELSEDLLLQRVSCPIGVLCVIFESRPEAIVQISSLAIKSGNAIILKGGKEATHTNACLVGLIQDALASVAGIPADTVQYVSSREAISELLKLDGYIDLVIPRGSNKLVRVIKENTRIPVMGHADGICSIYLDPAADLTKAISVIVDSKTNYPAACNSTERLLVHRNALQLLPMVIEALLSAGVTCHCDGEALAIAAPLVASGIVSTGRVVELTEEARAMEWLSLDISVMCVSSMQEAIAEINSSGSHHTDAIITESADAALEFASRVDSAGVYHNASTRFADGYRYGFGAEVGISTNRIHARGPVGLEGLVTYKYLLSGHGECVGQYGATTAATVTIGGIMLPTKRFAHKDLIS